MSENHPLSAIPTSRPSSRKRPSYATVLTGRLQTAQTLTLGYRSPRKLCDLAHGFVEGVAAHYGETVTFSQPACMHDGAPSCQLQVTWPQ